ASRGSRTDQQPRGPIHLRRPGAFRARRLPGGKNSQAREICIGALEPGHAQGCRADARALQVRQLRQRDLCRQRHQDRAAQPRAPPNNKYPWRLDDEKLMYPFYEKAVKAGITTICIHKGLLPKDYETSAANSWQYATVDDVPKAAKDWPQLNFVIYHAAKQAFLVPPDEELTEFEKTGYIRWVSDLVAI